MVFIIFFILLKSLIYRKLNHWKAQPCFRPHPHFSVTEPWSSLIGPYSGISETWWVNWGKHHWHLNGHLNHNSNPDPHLHPTYHPACFPPALFLTDACDHPLFPFMSGPPGPTGFARSIPCVPLYVTPPPFGGGENQAGVEVTYEACSIIYLRIVPKEPESGGGHLKWREVVFFLIIATGRINKWSTATFAFLWPQWSLASNMLTWPKHEFFASLKVAPPKGAISARIKTTVAYELKKDFSLSPTILYFRIM